MQYFGSNIVEGVAESWVEVEGAKWRWVHGLVIPENKYARHRIPNWEQACD